MIEAGDKAILIHGVIQCEIGKKVEVLGKWGSRWMVKILDKDDYAFRVVSEYSLQLLPKVQLKCWPPDPETFLD